MSPIETRASRRQVVIECVTPTHLVKYAGASGDFNPLHHDDAFAQRHGYPGLFGHGMFTMGLTAKILTDWFGPAAIRSYGVRFTRQVWPGDRLETSATVVAVDGNELTVELETRNQRDEVVLTGDALVTVTSDATDTP